MTLFDILQQMEGPDYLPLSVTNFLNDSVRKIIDCRPQSCNKIELRFMLEDETWITVSTYSPVLVPWYNCTVSGIDPVDNDTLATAYKRKIGNIKFKQKGIK